MQTPLYHSHIALGAKMVDFNGWQMPISYQGILTEHQAVRENVGIFDLSHMGKVDIIGPDAEPFMDFLSTNQIKDKPVGSATYTVWMNAKGGSVDDLIVYKQSADHYFVIVNAGNREKDLAHLLQQALKWNVEIVSHYSDEGIIAIQGPNAIAIVSALFPQAADLKPMHFEQLNFEGDPLILSATGYTGSGGFEIFTSQKNIPLLWDYFAQTQKVSPIGLGARDTLRLEMGYALYGHELSETIAPTESVSAWTVKMNKPHFFAKETLSALENSGHKRFSYGILLLDQGIAREGSPIFFQDREIGAVTSGTFAPTLNRAIALILVKQKLNQGDIVHVQVRGKLIPAQLVKPPFVNLGKHNEKVHRIT